MRAPVAAVAVALCLGAVLALPARASESWTCWSATESDGGDRPRTITRCRIAGETTTHDYRSASGAPVVLSPTVGADTLGTCWYWTSADSPWLLIGYDADGNAILGYDPDDAIGGPIVIDTTERICTSEPVEIPPAEVEAYQLLSTYVHPRPEPLLDPPPGRGVAGMQTFVRLDVPDRWQARLTSPVSGRTITVETWVEGVEIVWGDGSVSIVPLELVEHLTGYPDGIEPHIYEAKTCGDREGARCHPELSAYPIEIKYLWQARYRVGAGGWMPIVVEPTSVEIDYPVTEIVSVITGVG